MENFFLKKQDIAIKGQSSIKKEGEISLGETFKKLHDNNYSVSDCINYLKSKGISISKEGFINRIFSYRKNQSKVYTFAGPFKIGEVPVTILEFNLEYQDSVIKIALKQKNESQEDKASPEIINEKIETCIILVCMLLLNTDIFKTTLYKELTNIELDNLVLKCLEIVNLIESSDKSQLLHIGNKANYIAYNVIDNILGKDNENSIYKLIKISIFSGVIWWSDLLLQKQFENDSIHKIAEISEKLKKYINQDIAVNNFRLFEEEVINSLEPKDVIYFLDDNGELVADLLIIKQILLHNNRIKITCVINSLPVTNNANIFTLTSLFNQIPEIGWLQKNERFSVYYEDNELSTFDLRFSSEQLYQKLNTSDIIIIKGASFFEKMQYMPSPTYYLFSTYSNLSSVLTGIEKYSGIFARVAPSSCSFGSFSDTIEGFTANINLKILLS